MNNRVLDIDKSYATILNNIDCNNDNVIFSPAGIREIMELLRMASFGKTRSEIENAIGKYNKNINFDGGWAWNLVEISDDAYYNLPVEEKKKCWKGAYVSSSKWLVLNCMNKNVTIKNDFKELFNNNEIKVFKNLDEIKNIVHELNTRIANESNNELKNIIEVKDYINNNFAFEVGNIVNFKGRWVSNKLETKHMKFKNTNNSTVICDAIVAEYEKLIENEETIGIVMPYAGGRHVFIALMPKNGYESINMQGLHGYDGDIQLSAKLPKFKVENSHDSSKLINSLKSIGINDLFDKQNANLENGFSYPRENNIYLSTIKQNSILSLDEIGTTASAVTRGGGVLLGEFFEPKRIRYVELNFNKSFTFMVYDKIEKEVVFMGKINNIDESNDIIEDLDFEESIIDDMRLV